MQSQSRNPIAFSVSVESIRRTTFCTMRGSSSDRSSRCSRSAANSVGVPRFYATTTCAERTVTSALFPSSLSSSAKRDTVRIVRAASDTDGE